MKLESVINHAISTISASFCTNELAYLSLTQKIELPIRDKLAYRLQSTLDQEYANAIVCREWYRTDIAIFDENELVCALEAKAIYSFDIIKNGKKHNYPVLIEKDLDKAQEVARKRGHLVKPYSLLIATHPEELPHCRYCKAVKYYGGLKRYTNDRNNFSRCHKELKSRMAGYRIAGSHNLSAGRAFGVDVSLFVWLLRR